MIRVSVRRAAVLLGSVLLLFAACARQKAPRLFVIGFDGATWERLEPWIEAGDLPNLKALRDRSSWGTLNSVIPYLSPPAWTSATTGVNPGRHGIFDFQRRLPGDNKIVTETANSRTSPPIWNLLKGRGPRVAIVNIPMTDPPDEVDGVMVAGLPHADEYGFAYPKSLEEELRAEAYPLDKMEMNLPDGKEQQVFDGLMANLRRRAELVKRLYQKEQYDLFWVVFTETDRVQHMFWKFDDPQHPYYSKAKAEQFGGSIRKLWLEQDRVLGELLEMIAPDSWILVLSDHGFGPMRRELRVGNYIRRPGSEFTQKDVDEVFCLDKSDAARLYVREPGKDPGGNLGAAERNALTTKLVDAMTAATEPVTGARPVEAAYRREQVFVGVASEKGPTVTYLPSDGWFLTLGDHDLGFKLPPFGDITSTLSGWHRMNGVFALSGPGVAPGRTDVTYSLLDIVPTCFYVLDQAMPEDLDGKVMERCFTGDWLGRHQAVRQGRVGTETRSLTPEEERALQNLPYIGSGK